MAHSLDFEKSSRRDLWVWMLLLVGAGFITTAYTVDPLENCNTAGECAPWLVPIAGIMGWAGFAMALGLLIVNPNRGCRIDPGTGDLIWWKNRTIRSSGDEGRIHPSRIARIRLDTSTESHNVSLYDHDGERLHYFDEELIPWRHDRWAVLLQQHYPHIEIDRLD